MTTLSIGQLAQAVGVGVETIRFYERKGLLTEPDRGPSNYRRYPPASVRRLTFIRQAQRLGFTLAEIEDLLGLREDPDASRADVRRRAEAKVADIDARVQDLLRIRADLQTLLDRCHGDGPADECPIIQAIDPPNHDTTPEPKEQP